MGSMIMQVHHEIALGPSTRPRTYKQINEHKTQRHIVDKTYDMDDDSTVKWIIFQHPQFRMKFPQFMEKFPQFKMKFPQKGRKAKTKTVDINEAHYNMGWVK
jgi:hypothetical protein